MIKTKKMKRTLKSNGLKFLFGVLLCVCSAAAQAQTDISSVGSISITSITGTNAATVYNNGSGPVTTTASGGVGVIINFAGTINLANITAGQQIVIPISVAAGSHFPTLNLTFNSTTPDGYFTVSYTTGVIRLTATSKITGVTGVVPLSLQGTATLNTTGGTLTQLRATATTYVLDNNTSLSYAINNTPTTLTPSNNCNISVSTSATATLNAFSLMYSIPCLYNQLLTNNGAISAADLTGNNSWLTNNYIQVATIPANANISSVNLYSTYNGKPVQYMNFTTGGRLSGTNMTNFTATTAFTQDNSITDSSMASLEANLPAGEFAIISYPDGSYAIAVNWGPLINNPLVEWVPSASSSTGVPKYGDDSATMMVNAAVSDAVSALQNRLYFAANFADPSIQNSVPITITSNLPNVFATSTGGTLTNTPVKNVVTGQTTIKIHYVTLNGGNLQNVLLNYGYPVNNTANATPSDSVHAAPATITGYTLVTNNAVLDTMQSIPINAILTGDSTIGFPSSGTTDVYYVYASEASSLPITGLYLTAQLQNNNTVVQLVWGTTTEISSKNFTLQRSADGGKTWVTVVTLPTQALNGNSSVPLTYHATDQIAQSGNYEYRVVETDLNGNTSVSNTVPISASLSGVAVFPNPVKSVLNVVLPAGVTNVLYRLISANGKTVLSNILSSEGKYGQIPVAGIASGIYFLQLNINGAIQTHEVQIQQ